MLFEGKDVNFLDLPVTHVLTGTTIENIFTPGKCMEGAVLDYIIDDWCCTSEQYKTGERVLLSPEFIKVRPHGMVTLKLYFCIIDLYCDSYFSHCITTY